MNEIYKDYKRGALCHVILVTEIIAKCSLLVSCLVLFLVTLLSLVVDSVYWIFFLLVAVVAGYNGPLLCLRYCGKESFDPLCVSNGRELKMLNNMCEFINAECREPGGELAFNEMIAHFTAEV